METSVLTFHSDCISRANRKLWILSHCEQRKCKTFLFQKLKILGASQDILLDIYIRGGLKKNKVMEFSINLSYSVGLCWITVVQSGQGRSHLATNLTLK